MTDFTLATDADGVATLTWDVAGKSMNVMSTEGFSLLDALIGQALADPTIKGIILTSGKRDFAGEYAGNRRTITSGGRRWYASRRLALI